MADDTWNTRAVPIMEAIATREGEVGSFAIFQSSSFAETAGCTMVEAQVEVARLISGGFVAGEVMAGVAEDTMYQNVHLLERGARVVRMWPSEDVYETLLATLQAGIDDDATDPETRTKLEKLRGAAADAGKNHRGERHDCLHQGSIPVAVTAQAEVCARRTRRL